LLFPACDALAEEVTVERLSPEEPAESADFGLDGVSRFE
jgi:hypothetical protein